MSEIVKVVVTIVILSYPGIYYGGGLKFLFYLFSNYNYSLTHYQQITVNILLYGLYIIGILYNL
jgi:hypothetical protein